MINLKTFFFTTYIVLFSYALVNYYIEPYLQWEITNIPHYIDDQYVIVYLTNMSGFKISSNQVNKSLFSTSIQDPKLNPWFVTGLTDAEGCFTITISPSTKMSTKWRVSPSFSMNLHIKDMPMLEKLINTLGVGTIRKSKTGMAMFSVTSVKGLQIIIDHFDKYPLISAKAIDFSIFKQCFEIIKDKKHLTPEGLLSLVALRGSLNWGLSDSLKESFPNIVSVNRPNYVFNGISDPNWLAGFSSGEGSFQIITNTDSNVRLKFNINLNIREKGLIEGIVLFLKSHSANLGIPSVVTNTKICYISGQVTSLQITKFADIVNIIIPFFEKYKIVGIKSLDFIDFKKAADIIKNKEHLSSEGFNEILKLKSGMNRNREW